MIPDPRVTSSNEPVAPETKPFTWSRALAQISAAQVALLALVLLFGVLALWLSWQLRGVLFALVAALILHTGMKPAVDALEKRGVNRRIGVGIVYALLLLVVAGIVVVLVPMISGQIAALAAKIPEYYELVRNLLINSGIDLLVRLGNLLPPPTDMQGVGVVLIEASAAEGATTPSAGIGESLGGLGRSLFGLLALFSIAFYLTIDRDRILQSWLLRMEPENRADAREITGEVEGKVGAFIRGQLILCTVVGAFSFAAYLLIGLPYAPALGALAFIFEAVPMVGPLLSAIPAVIVAATIGPDKLVWVILAVVVIQFAENNLLVPRVMDRAVGVNAIVSLLSIVAFSYVFGFAGAVLAIPLAAVIQVLLNRYLFAEAEETQVESLLEAGEEGTRSIDNLLRMKSVELAQDVRKQFRVASDEASAQADAVEDSIELAALDLYAALGGEELQAQGTPQIASEVTA